MATVSLKKLFIQITPAKDKLPALANLLTANFRGNVDKGALLYADKNPEKASAVVLYAKGVSSAAFTEALKTSGLERPEVESLLKVNDSLQLLEISNPSQTNYLQSNPAQVEFVDKPETDQTGKTVTLEGQGGKYTPSADNFNLEKVDVASQMVSKEVVNSRIATAEMYDLPADRFDIPTTSTSAPTIESQSLPVQPDNASTGFTTAEAPQEPTNIPPAAFPQAPPQPLSTPQVPSSTNIPRPQGSPALGNAARNIGGALRKGIGALGNAITPGLGTAINTLTDPKKLANAIKKGVALGIAGLTGMASMFVAAILAILTEWVLIALSLVIWVAIIIFIINSGAYVVPPGGFGYPGESSDICVYGSCPLPNAIITCGSLGSGHASCEHGTNAYWNYQLCTSDPSCSTATPRTCCSTDTVCSLWALPSSDAANCHTNQVTGSYCYSPSSTCSYYGLAADIVDSTNEDGCGSGSPVTFPYLNGSRLSWSRVWGGNFSGSNQQYGLYTATDGTAVYEIFFTHQQDMVASGQSGQRVGDIYCFPNPDANHTHYELKINGSYVRPDYLCSGASADGCTQPPTEVGVVDCYAAGPYGADYDQVIEPQLTTFTSPPDGRVVQVLPSIVGDLNNFIAAAANSGSTLAVYEGYRSYQEQLDLCLDCNARLQDSDPTNDNCAVGPAAQSQHRTGQAIDMYIYDAGLSNPYTRITVPIINIGASHGFDHPYDDDWPHFYHP